jgi:hypothetical protein
MQIAIFATEFATLMASCAIVAVAQIALEFPAIMRDFGFIVTDVTMQAAIRRERRRDSHSHQQQNPSYGAFHVLLAPSQAVDVNTRSGWKLQRGITLGNGGAY